jgi:hypothetical protein
VEEMARNAFGILELIDDAFTHEYNSFRIVAAVKGDLQNSLIRAWDRYSFNKEHLGTVLNQSIPSSGWREGLEIRNGRLSENFMKAERKFARPRKFENRKTRNN